MWGGLTGMNQTAQYVNLAALVVLVIVAPIPLGRGFLPLEFVAPAAALVAVSWPTGLWLGTGALLIPAVTAIVFGYPAGVILRQVAQAAALAMAVAGLVKLAALARELAGVRTDLTELSLAQEGVTQRLRQSDELLGVLGWRLSVISRMSELTSRAADRRPGLADRELDQVRELACEWPGGSEPPAEVGGATALGAELHAVRNVLTTAGIECAICPVPAGLGGGAGDALAFFTREAAAYVLGQPGARSCSIIVSDDGARIRLALEWGQRPDHPDPVDAEAWAGVVARVGAVNGQCEVTGANGRGVLRANIPKPADW
jgi:hypothetical protein